MQILHDRDTIVSAGKDKNMKFWYPPATWEKTDDAKPKKGKLKTTSKPTASSKVTPKQPVKKQLGSDSDDSSDDEIVLKKPVNKQGAKVAAQAKESDDDSDDDGNLAKPSKVLSKPVTHVTNNKQADSKTNTKAPATVISKPAPNKPSPAPAKPVKAPPKKKIYDEDSSSDEYGNWQD